MPRSKWLMKVLPEIARVNEEENPLVKPKQNVSYHSAEEYLKEADLYRLGELPTEGRHTETKDLSRLVVEDPSRAYQILQSIDGHAIEVLFHHQEALTQLKHAIQETIQSGHRVILCGCGATGRLSLVLESIWKFRARDQGTGRKSDQRLDPDSVTAFMAGGDIALVRSVENFEDIPEFGARQLHELCFRDGDLLVSTTEGGETPFVIGATEEAARISKRKPWFLYCNPDAALLPVERSRRVIENPSIEKISLPTGPMSLSGSTRLQASTVLMLAVGIGLLGGSAPMAELFEEVERFLKSHDRADFSVLLPLAREEADVYERGHYILYETDRYGISVLTDTTERSPTFSLQGFENSLDPDAPPALAYLRLPEARNPGEAWTRILGRLPRGLDWQSFQDRLGHQRALGFDFSNGVLSMRENRIIPEKQVRFQVLSDAQGIRMGALGAEKLLTFPVQPGGVLDDLLEQTLLKLILNRHSLLVMGYLKRYDGNLMTWVRPSNGKLIDRTLRYAISLLSERGFVNPGYDWLAQILFLEMKSAREDEPLVLKLVDRAYRERKRSSA